MKIIVALGNPGTKYEHTRHNAGWLVLDQLVESGKLKVESWEKKFDSEIFVPPLLNPPPLGEEKDRGASEQVPLPRGEGLGEGGKIILVKPQTFMNESGRAVREICDFYKIDIKKDLLIVHDDTDLPLGSIRTTNSSSAAGHNGVSDIIEKLGTQDFHRVRIGVESRESRGEMPTDAFVLQNFAPEETKKLREEVFPKVKEHIDKFLITNV